MLHRFAKPKTTQIIEHAFEKQLLKEEFSNAANKQFSYYLVILLYAYQSSMTIKTCADRQTKPYKSYEMDF